MTTTPPEHILHMLEKCMRRMRLSSSPTFIVLLYLLRRCDRDNQVEYTHTQMSEDLGLKRNTCMDAMHALQRYGVVTRLRKAMGRNTTSLCVVNWHVEEEED